MDSRNLTYPPKGERLLSIGAFSAASCLSQKALRLYDRHGLLKPAYTDPENGYRYYRAEQLRIAKLILLMRKMDMPLVKIRRMLAATPVEAGDMAMTFAKQAEEQAQRTRRVLGEFLSCLHTDPCGGKTMSETAMQVEAREMPPQLVLSISRRTKIEGLGDHIRQSMEQLNAFATSVGGEITSGAFGIFHGPVNKDDDGPMEVCLPVKGAFAPSGDIVLKELPGGTMVMVSGSGEYCEFPKVLELYDNAVMWMEKNAAQMAGPPREWWQGPNGEEGQMTVVWPYTSKPA